MKKANRILWGLALVALGVLLGLNALELIEFNLFFKGWWTLFLLVPGAIGLLTEKNKGGHLFALLLGVFLLLCAQGVLPYHLLWKLALPVAVVLVGLWLIVGQRRKSAATPPTPATNPAPHAAHCVAVFSGQELHFHGQPFKGAQTLAVFGGVELHAADAIITQDCTVSATAVFGGVDIHLPAHVNVVVTGGGLFGGVENQRRMPPAEGAPTVYVHTSFCFGGVEIK